jgi:hypothetical protein
MNTTKLFLDWLHVDKGAMEATYDSARISEEGYARIERNKKMFGIYPDLSGHGMKGIRLQRVSTVSDHDTHEQEGAHTWRRAD